MLVPPELSVTVFPKCDTLCCRGVHLLDTTILYFTVLYSEVLYVCHIRSLCKAASSASDARKSPAHRSTFLVTGTL